ncbi:MAG: hypothetical protein QM497_05115 [Sulfurimonas sp.]
MKNITLTIITVLSLQSMLNATTLSQAPTTNSLIVYNSNIGLVHEERKLSLKRTDKFIIYKDVANSIDTESVNVELPKDVLLFSQQYRYDKLTQGKLLDAFVGKTVLVDKKRVLLLSSGASRCVVKTSDELIKTVDAKEIVFESIPNELITKPSLVWNVTSKKDVNADMKIDYLIKNISWSSNYILKLKKNRADLSAWISIKNHSGKAFKDTELYVLAGDINRVHKNRPTPNVRYMRAISDKTAVREQAHEGYHFYTIPFKVNLANNEKTQIKFIDKKGVKFFREYSANLQNPLYLRGEVQADVSQFIKLQKLDLPLPKGVVRTYSKYKKSSILLGETFIKHTPKDVSIKLRIGKNFDTKVTQTVMKREDNKRYFNVDVKYAVNNASDEMKTIKLFVPFNKNINSKIKTDIKYRFTKGNLVTFSIKVKANATKSFTVNFQSKK